MIKLLTGSFSENKEFTDEEISFEVDDLLDIYRIKKKNVINIESDFYEKDDRHYCKVKIWYKN